MWAGTEMSRVLIRGGRHGALFARTAMLVASLALAGPAGAQWIGSAGGDGSPPARPPTAPLAPPPAASVAPAAASPSLGSAIESPGMSPGMASPGGFGELPNGGLAAPGGFSAAPQRGPSADCQSNVTALREDVEKNGNALKAAATRKRPPTEVCPLFRRFVSAQEKFYGYLLKNKTNCGVPDSALKSLKTNVAQVAKTRDKVCEVAANGPPPGATPGPPQGMLSSGLGLPTGLPSINADRPGGVYDTLGGNALR